MGLSEPVGQALGIPESSARFLLALFSGEILVKVCARNYLYSTRLVAYVWLLAAETDLHMAFVR